MVDSPPPGAYAGKAGKRHNPVEREPPAHPMKGKAENEDENKDEDEDDGCRPA
jgi:hypothetical protein